MELWVAYRSHYHRARRAGIEFKLTFNEWTRIWVDSGHIHERGVGANKYAMARHGDRGAYEIGNVKIITNSENSIEAHLGKKAPKARFTRKLNYLKRKYGA